MKRSTVRTATPASAVAADARRAMRLRAAGLTLATATAVAVASALLAPPPAHAANGNPSELGIGVALPPLQQSGDVSWVSGGIAEQADAFRANASRYPLTIELVERQRGTSRGAYTADAKVRIVDAKDDRTLLDAKADGPYMLVRLPDGRYRIEATLNGHTVQAGPIDVAAGRPSRAAMVFPPSGP